MSRVWTIEGTDIVRELISIVAPGSSRRGVASAQRRQVLRPMWSRALLRHSLLRQLVRPLRRFHSLMRQPPKTDWAEIDLDATGRAVSSHRRTLSVAGHVGCWLWKGPLKILFVSRLQMMASRLGRLRKTSGPFFGVEATSPLLLAPAIGGRRAVRRTTC